MSFSLDFVHITALFIQIVMRQNLLFWYYLITGDNMILLDRAEKRVGVSSTGSGHVYMRGTTSCHFITMNLRKANMWNSSRDTLKLFVFYYKKSIL